jgi:hypothetical protein
MACSLFQRWSNLRNVASLILRLHTQRYKQNIKPSGLSI